MAEQIGNIKAFTLSEVSRSIKKLIDEKCKNSFWVKAEINKLGYYPQSGHCYPELVEKSAGKIVVNMKANIWRDDYIRINQKFIKTINEPLKDHITVLMHVYVNYDTLYGLSLKIIDIDPNYSLGQLEREKLETIKKLKDEGIFETNKKLLLPVLPQRIAIISVNTSKGFADFKSVLNSNTEVFKYFGKLYPSILQGDGAVSSILSQLYQIERVKNMYDIVAIIRGGGGDIGLTCYNDYNLAKRIALFPLPILTGIGHSTNETIVEMISNQNFITPTKLAEFLISKFDDFLKKIVKFEEIISSQSLRILSDENSNVKNISKMISSSTKNHLTESKGELTNIVKTLNTTSKSTIALSNSAISETRKILTKSSILFLESNQKKLIDYGGSFRHKINYQLVQAKNLCNNLLLKITENYNTQIKKSETNIEDEKSNLLKFILSNIKNEKKSLENIEKNVRLMDPKNILRRGFSITLLNGKSLMSLTSIKENSEIETVLYNGSFKSKVISINKEK